MNRPDKEGWEELVRVTFERVSRCDELLDHLDANSAYYNLPTSPYGPTGENTVTPKQEDAYWNAYYKKADQIAVDLLNAVLRKLQLQVQLQRLHAAGSTTKEQLNKS